MEYIRQAIERAKEHHRLDVGSSGSRPNRDFSATRHRWENQIELDLTYLQSQRIVAFDGQDARSRSFDMLRTEVLRSMDLKGWKTLAVTSPTADCGKTLTAINLALSIARQPERQVFLADLDLRKPRVAKSLGLDCPDGALGVLQGRIAIDSAVVLARIGASNLSILPTMSTSNSSDLISSNEMKVLLQEVSLRDQSRIVILDLPPLLTGHDALSILPQVDCVLLVAAVGTSKISEIDECKKYLQSKDIVRFVLNKVPDSEAAYAYY